MVRCTCVAIVASLLPLATGSATWKRLAPTSSDGPDAREATILEVVGDAAYIYGGSGDGDGNVFDDTWKFDIVQQKWSILQQQPSPGLRFAHSSAARPAMHEIYVFGGTILNMSILGADYTQTNDLWKLDTVTEKWSQVQLATPVAPIPRSEATAVAVGNDSLVVFGGVVVPTNNSYPIDLNDLWSFSYDAKTWTQLGSTNKLDAPLTRFSHASTTLTVDGVLYVAVFSGRHITNDGWTILNDAWMFPLSEDAPQVWTELNAYPPFDRIFTQVLTSPSGVWTFGGLNFVGQNQDSAIAYADTIYAPSDNLPQLDLLYDYAVDLSTISARYNHRMALWHGHLIVYGGKFQSCLGDLWLRNSSFLPSDPSPYITNPATLSSIMFLFVAFLVLFFTSIFLIAYMYRRYRRHNGSRRTAHVVRPRGLSQEQINHFELVKFSPLTPPTDEMCPICLIEYASDDELRQLPCMHRYHPPCIDEWLKKNQTCPMCKRDVTASEEDPPVPSSPTVLPPIVIDRALLDE
ncbi:hypothetical protein LEN26_005998 [Aphanomyces euteiches]|nr:hypothetical protein AeMF1_010589 [Aphanomyces euteiches]KAH9136869.1 hypothetical protein LEN26_005998 [Aphanomyces euteiches]KAH9193229.1 hypothetical protein AeNC1_004791 [Aphanomyces euteiches]